MPRSFPPYTDSPDGGPAVYQCQECSRKFKTARAAERAANYGCPNCGGVDIDLSVDCPDPDPEAPELRCLMG